MAHFGVLYTILEIVVSEIISQTSSSAASIGTG